MSKERVLDDIDFEEEWTKFKKIAVHGGIGSYDLKYFFDYLANTYTALGYILIYYDNEKTSIELTDLGKEMN